MTDTLNPSGTKKKLSATRRIEQALKEEIGAGELLPGQRLDEQGLAERFAVSRTPVREALSHLVAQGVLARGQSRGVFVANYGREELGQIFEAMQEIEAACARIVSQRLNLLARSEIEEAQAACVKAAEAGDRAAYLRANDAFHMAIYRATGNQFMAKLASEFRRRTGPFRAKKFASRADLIASAKSHRVLMDGIFSADSNVAANSMRSLSADTFMKIMAAS